MKPLSSFKNSDALLSQSAIVSLKFGCEYTNATIIPTKIIFTMAIQYSFELKHTYLVKRTINL